jgi:hypothetical protein
MTFLTIDVAEAAKPSRVDELNLRADLMRAGIMVGIEDVPAGTRKAEPSPAIDLFSTEGYGCIVIPPELFGDEVTRFTKAIVRSVLRMEPACTPMHKAVYRTLTRLADQGATVTPNALVLGLLLAAAKVHNVTIKTHARDLAKEAKIRYAVLLKIRAAAVLELSAI